MAFTECRWLIREGSRLSQIENLNDQLLADKLVNLKQCRIPNLVEQLIAQAFSFFRCFKTSYFLTNLEEFRHLFAMNQSKLTS